MTGGYSFRDDGRTGVFSDMNHLRTGIGLLIVVGHGHTVELRLRIVTS